MRATIQKGFLKITLTISVVILQLPCAHAQSPAVQLATADSLFFQKKYTQSFEYYQSVFNQNLYSPAMLLRMAYIEEGLGRFANVMYYLSLYYGYTFDEAVLDKVQELAASRQLIGYEWSVSDRLTTTWRRYGYWVTLILAVAACLLTGLVVFQVKRKRNAMASWISQMVVLALLLIHVNFPFNKKAIIQHSNTFLMSGPSAGAAVVDKVGQGHRVTVLGEADVWVKINWKEREVFVRESDLHLLNL
jgi:hypothetical protein